MSGAYYSDPIATFLTVDPRAILGELLTCSSGSVDSTQRRAWEYEINFLRTVLQDTDGWVGFEFSIPRLGARIDTIVLTENVVFVIEFKVGQREFTRAGFDQVWDYALDLKNFHQPSHHRLIVPILIATEACSPTVEIALTAGDDGLVAPVRSTPDSLKMVLSRMQAWARETRADDPIDGSQWFSGSYQPTPTIIEAALALYRGHDVAEISRNDAGARNLRATTEAIDRIIADAKIRGRKAICFVTGVPGAGKTLVGLNIATRHLNSADQTYSVFLSGNGPLVQVLREALARDRVRRARGEGQKLKKGTAVNEVKAFIQNVHHYRDAYLVDFNPPADHVALFDEAQRAWDLDQTASFMKQKKNQPDFTMSEPEFLISCIDRHDDWGVIICLVGGGQEINRGEAGIGEWVRALVRSFPDWEINISDRLTQSEYGATELLDSLRGRTGVSFTPELHLDVSMRSFRAEHLSTLVRELLDFEVDAARSTYAAIKERYPIAVTRDLNAAKTWMRQRARGTERYGLVVSSKAERLKPYSIDVRAPINPVHWFLGEKEDVRSCYYCEDAVSEFKIQGLELDWACVTWDADFYPVTTNTGHEWIFREFHGSSWKNVHKSDRRHYLKNAYRVLLTRARQGMVIFVPSGDDADLTRSPIWYDAIFDYLVSIGIPEFIL